MSLFATLSVWVTNFDECCSCNAWDENFEQRMFKTNWVSHVQRTQKIANFKIDFLTMKQFIISWYLFGSRSLLYPNLFDRGSQTVSEFRYCQGKKDYNYIQLSYSSAVVLFDQGILITIIKLKFEILLISRTLNWWSHAYLKLKITAWEDCYFKQSKK